VPVRTRRGSGFEPLISRAVRGSVWAAPSFAFAAIEGSGRASPRSAGWQHSVAWVLVAPALLQAGAGRPSHAHAPFFRELISSRARGSCRSRVLRGMGARGACFTSSRPQVTFSRRCPFEGCRRLEPGARAARGFCVAWVLVVPALLQAGPGRPSHGDVPSRAEIILSQGLVPLEGFARHGCSWCLLYFKQAPSDLRTPMSLRGLSSSRVRGSPRSRVLLAWQGSGPLNALQLRPWLCNAGAPF
jgi:hypothetical protein